MKKKKSLRDFFFLVVALSMASYSFAMDKKVDNLKTPFRAYIAPQIARLKFQIVDFAVFRGVVGGGSAAFEYRPVHDFYGGVTAEWMIGSVSSRDKMSRSIHDLDGQFRIGYTLSMWRFAPLTFTPYAGIGYEYIVQNFRSDLVLPSLKFRYYHYYIPVGMIINFNLLSYFNFGIAGQWRPDINARMKTPYIEGLHFDLKKEAGYIVELPFQFLFGNEKVKGEFSLIPYLKREVDGKLRSSLPSGAIVRLAEQDYKYWGLRVLLGARF